MLSLKFLCDWITQSLLYKKLFNPKDHLSTETFLFRVRCSVWIFLFTFFIVAMPPTPDKRSIQMNYFSIIFSIFMIYLWSKGINQAFIGILHMLSMFGYLVTILQDEQFYLHLFMASFPVISIFSLNFYPVYFWIPLNLGFFGLKEYFSSDLENNYEPITDTYRIAAYSIKSYIHFWKIFFLLQVAILSFYQIVNKKTVDNYQLARKNLEETQTKLQEANKKLTESLDERDAKNKELQKMIKARDLFVACISHDLRNPLNVILGNIDILSIGRKDIREIQILKACKLCGKALLRQINNLLDVSKMNANKFELNPSQVDMIGFLEKFWAYAKIGLEKKHLEGILAIDKNIPKSIKVDQHRLHQILDNLTSNAIKFTEKGSVRMTFSWIHGSYKLDSSCSLEESFSEIDEQENLSQFAEVGKYKSSRIPKSGLKINNKGELEDRLCFKYGNSIKETLERSLPSYNQDKTNFLKIEIADTGCGISQEAQAKLFQPFAQADCGVSSIYGGTGLGLYIVKNIVERMEGAIKLNSIKNIGTRFQIFLKIKNEN